jgi:NADPH:quinone reductase-like Zn-dependent oxidoreductase
VQHGKGGGWRAIRHFAGVRLGSLVGSRRVVVLFITKVNKADLEFLGGLLGSGEVTPVIDRSYSRAQVSEALGYLDTGHPRAKVAIDLDGSKAER